MPNNCFHCEVEIDGEDVKGIWFERERWQNPNTHELTCLSCCVEEMNESPNRPDTVDETDVTAHRS